MLPRYQSKGLSSLSMYSWATILGTMSLPRIKHHLWNHWDIRKIYAHSLNTSRNGMRVSCATLPHMACWAQLPGAAVLHDKLWSEAPGTRPLHCTIWANETRWSTKEKGKRERKNIFLLLKLKIGEERQDGGVEGLELTSSHENTKLTTNCWTTINKKDLHLPKKVFYIHRQRRSHGTVGGALLWYNQIPYPPGGQPTNCKIIILQRFSHRSERSETHVRLPSLGGGGVWHQEEEPPEHLALKVSGAWVGAPQDWGKQTEIPLLEGVHKLSCALGPRAKQWLHKSLGQTYLGVLGGSPCEAGVGCGSLRGHGHWWQRPQGILITVSSPRGHHFGTKTWPYPTACRLQCWDTSGQTTNMVGTQLHPSSNRLPKVVLSQ